MAQSGGGPFAVPTTGGTGDPSSDDTRVVRPDRTEGAARAPAAETILAPHTDLGDDEPTRIAASPFGSSLPAGTRAIPSDDAPYGATRLVGRYQVVERVGQGAMATVYKAYDPGIHRTLALKFLHPALCADAEYRDRFLREARAAGALSHPNIVTVFDVGELEGRPYIAMEFLEGHPLSEVAHAGTTLPIREVVAIGSQLARALDYAHAKGVIHRDIKPANIVRLGEGARTTIKVTDFGIAHLETAESASATRAGTILGTPHYMSPEQAIGQRVDSRSDLFSAGVMLYQLLTGRTPFQGDNLVTLAHQIAKSEPQALSRLRPDVPPALRRIVERCLRKQPEKRFQTGADMADALDRVAAELDEQARSAGQKRVIPLRVKWTLIMATVVALTMAITAGIVIDRQYGALRDGVLDYGSSLTRFMATQHRAVMLEEDWVAMEIIAQELVKNQDFKNIVSIDFVDRGGVVRASNDSAAVGKPFAQPAGSPVKTERGNVAIETKDAGSGEPVFAFDVPVTFQDKQVGTVHLGLSKAPLARVARLTLILMIVLAVVTVLAVTAATWLLAERYAKPIRLLAESMGEIGKGHYEYRIAEQRSDELGALFRAFDDMAATLQQRSDAHDASHGDPPRVDTTLVTDGSAGAGPVRDAA